MIGEGLTYKEAWNAFTEGLIDLDELEQMIKGFLERDLAHTVSDTMVGLVIKEISNP